MTNLTTNAGGSVAQITVPTTDNPKTSRRPWPSKVGLLVLFFCAAHTFDLLDAWRSSPSDAFAWVALLIWLSPLAILRWIDRDHDLVGHETHVLYALALTVSLAGQIGRINALEHFGMILAMTGLLRFSWRSMSWLAAGISWMPAFGWLAIQSWPDQVLTLRVALAMVGAGLAMAPVAKVDRHFISLPQMKRGILLCGIACAMVLGGLWKFVPLQGAERRLVEMPTKGPGFRSWNAPLREEERKLLGHGLAARRIYQVDSQQFVVSVVDGTLNRHAIHDPMYCFAGAGYRVLSDDCIMIEGGTARWLCIEQDGHRSNIVYWFSDGVNRHTSILGYWLETTLRRMSFGGTGPEPVLVIVQCDSKGNMPLGKFRACRALFGV